MRQLSSMRAVVEMSLTKEQRMPDEDLSKKSWQELLTPTVCILKCSLWRLEHWWIADGAEHNWPTGRIHLGGGVFFRTTSKKSELNLKGNKK